MKNIIKFAIFGLSMMFIISYFMSQKEEIRLVFNLNVQSNIALLALIILVNIINAAKNFILVTYLGLRMPFTEWFKIFVIARFINQNISQSGNLYRLATLKKSYSFPYTKAISSSVFFVWFEFVSIAVFVLVLITVLPSQEGFDRGSLFAGTAAVLCLLILIPFGTMRLWPNLNVRHEKFNWAVQKMNDLNTYFLEFLKNPKMAAFYILLTCAVFLTFACTTQICFHAIGRPVDFVSASLFTVILYVTRSVNILPGNIGLSEVICGYFAKALGNSVGEGIIVSSIIRVIGYLFLAFMSLYYLRFNVRNLNKDAPPNDP